MEFDFSSDTPNRPKKGPPKRFLMRNTPASVSSPKVDVPPAVQSSENTLHRRFKPTSPCKDGPITYTKETAITALEQAIPQFQTQNSIIETSSKWKDKVDAFQVIQDVVKENNRDLNSFSEALVLYGLQYTNQCTASNINIMRSGLDYFKTVVQLYPIGPRIASTLVPCLLNKIHEKALFPVIAEILLLLCEKVGPDEIIHCIITATENSKKAIQQKAVLQWTLQVLLDFGAANINVKMIIQFLQTPQALQSTTPDVKKTATAILIEMYKQMGSVVLQLVDQFSLPELQLKHIREELGAINFDPEYAGHYQQIPASTTPAEPATVVSLTSLVDPVDVTVELRPIISDLKAEGKDSWKVRLEAVSTLMELLAKKTGIVHTPAVDELIVGLKNRFSETNLNLRAKMIQAVGIVASKVPQGLGSQTNTVMADLLRYTGDSSRAVVEATFSTLTQWVSQNTQLLSQVLVQLPIALKSPKGRQGTLQWLQGYVKQCEGKALLPIISGVLDGILDKSKESRNAASDILEVLLEKCGVETVMQEVKNRKPIDMAQLKSIIEALAIVPVSETPTPVPVEEKPKEVLRRREALAKRPGVRLLTKPKLGPDGKPIPKYNVKSSIPKPMPRIPREPKKVFAVKPSVELMGEEEVLRNEEVGGIALGNEEVGGAALETGEEGVVALENNVKEGVSVLETGEGSVTLENDVRDEIGVEIPLSGEPILPDPSSSASETPIPLSLGIPLTNEELLFDEETVDLEEDILTDETPFSSTFLQSVQHLSFALESQVITQINSIVKACFPNYPVNSLIRLSSTDIDGVVSSFGQWLPSLLLYHTSTALFQQSVLNLLLCVCHPTSPLFRIVPRFTIDSLSILLEFLFSGEFSTTHLVLLTLLIQHAPAIVLLWSLTHLGYAKQKCVNYRSLVTLLERCVSQLRKRIEGDSTLVMTEKEKCKLFEFSKRVLPSSLFTQVDLCLMAVAVRKGEQEGVRKMNVELPNSIQREIANRVKQGVKGISVTEVDQKMVLIRQRMEAMQKKNVH